MYIYKDCSIQGNMAQSGAIQMWNHLRVIQAHLVNNHPWCKNLYNYLLKYPASLATSSTPLRRPALCRAYINWPNLHIFN